MLVTEGTYPHAHGGVSVWCDQLVQGLPDHSFRVVALTAFGHQRPVWPLPKQVDEVVTVALWDNERRSPGRARRRPALAEALASLLVSPEDEVARFCWFLDELAMLDRAEITRQLSFAKLVRALDSELHRSGTWTLARAAPAADLVKVANILEHLLRPLTADPGPAAIYHASSNGLAALVCMVATRRYGGQFILTEHGIYLRERYLELRRLPLARPAKALLLRFHRLVTAAAYAEAAVIAPGSRWNQRWETRNGAPVDRLRTIYNGIDPTEFPDRDQEAPQPVVAWLGRIDPIKDLDTLIRAFAVVHDRRPDAELRLYGRIPASSRRYHQRLEQLVAELGLDSVVSFAGGVERSADAYQDAQLGVLSSISEGFPYSLIEAMACGLPTVATGVGGVPEAVADTGLVVPARSPERLGEAIVELLDDAPRRRDMGIRARRRVLGQFTVAQCLDGYRAIYAALASASSWTPPIRLGDDQQPFYRGHFYGPQNTLTHARALDPEHRDELTAAVGGADALAAAVDIDEVAATLESVGLTDEVAVARFGSNAVFDLAERLWISGGKHRSRSAEPRRPRLPTLRTRGAIARGVIHVLPAAVVTAAVLGGADEAALMTASAAGWGMAQAGGVLAYTAHLRSPGPRRDLTPLRRGLMTAVGTAAMLGVALARLRSSVDAGLTFSFPLLHLVGATSLVIAGRTRLLLALLAPVSAMSIVAMAAPNLPLMTQLVGPIAVLTVAVTLGVVAWSVRGSPPEDRLLERHEWFAAVPLAGCGWLVCGFALLSVRAISHQHSFVKLDSRQWLLLGLPVWVTVATTEWLLLRMRRSLAALLESSPTLGTFRSRGRQVVALWTLAGIGALTAAVALVVSVSTLTTPVALVAGSVFAVVAVGIYGATVLTAASRLAPVMAVMGAAVLGLVWVTSTSGTTLGARDPLAALVIGAVVGLVLCVLATRTLADPASQR